MPTFEQGNVVKVPFPFTYTYTNCPTRQYRPALVVSTGGGNDTLGLRWVVMVTSAENRSWPGAVTLADLSGTGLPAPSLVRTAKIATIDAHDAARLGQVEPDVRAEVMARVAERLGVSV